MNYRFQSETPASGRCKNRAIKHKSASSGPANASSVSFHIAAASGRKIFETKREPYGDLRSPVYSDPKKFPAEGHSPSVADRLRALNATGSDHRKMLDRLKNLAQSDDELTQSIFRDILHRDATGDELAHAKKHLNTGFSRSSAVEDIFWVLINSREYQSKQNPQSK